MFTLKDYKNRAEDLINSWYRKIEFTEKQEMMLDRILYQLMNASTKNQFITYWSLLKDFHRVHVKPVLESKPLLNSYADRLSKPLDIEPNTIQPNVIQPKSDFLLRPKADVDIESKYTDENNNAVDKSLNSKIYPETQIEGKFRPSRDLHDPETVKLAKKLAGEFFKEVNKREGTMEEVVKAQEEEISYYNKMKR